MGNTHNLSMMVIAVGCAVITAQASTPTPSTTSEPLTSTAAGPALASGSMGLAKRKACNLEYTSWSPTISAARVIADAWAWCEVTPEEHTVILDLEKQKPNGDWELLATKKFDKKEEIPNPRAEYRTTAECQPGTWRMNMSVTGSLQGNPFVWSPGPSGKKDVTAKDCPIG
ncbi:hypothetical protein [Nocardia sp. NPDC004722]